jgi:hypothetical protein
LYAPAGRAFVAKTHRQCCLPAPTRVMARVNWDQGQLFYSFCLDEVVP